MKLAWKFLRFGWQRMGDVGKLKTIWWLLPSVVAVGLTNHWAEAAASPLFLWFMSVMVFVGVFISLLVAAGYYELEKIKAAPNNFKCDFQTLKSLCLLLAHVKSDATDYSPFRQDMLNRLGELNEYRALFIESAFANDYLSFWNGVGMSVESKRTHLSAKDREMFGEMIAESYSALKSALDSDYEKSRP